MIDMKWSLIPRVLVSLASLAPFAAYAAETKCPAPEPFKATYYSEIDHLVTLKGEGVQELQLLPDGLYQFRFDVESLVADMRESVVFEWDSQDCLLIPVRYRQSLEGKLISDRRTDFTNYREDNEYRGHYRSKAFTTDSKDRYVDPLGLQIQVRQDLKAGKKEMKYYMVHKGKVLIDRYRVVESEPLKIEGKTYDTIKLEKVRPDTSDRETYMWMAPELDYALVRLLHQEPDGERYEVILKSFKQ